MKEIVDIYCEYLVISESNDFYAIDIKNIETIIHTQQLRNFPNVPRYILGATVFQDSLIPVFDLSNLLNLESKNFFNQSEFYVIVIKANNHFIGINVDVIIEIIEHNKTPRKDALLSKNHNHLFLGSIKLNDLHYLAAEKQLINVIDIQNIYKLIEQEMSQDE